MRTRTAPTSGVARLARVGVLGGTSMLLACAAHGLAGGRLPSAGVLAVAAILLGLVAVTVTARRCRPGLLLTVLSVQQVLLHLLFDAASTTGSDCRVVSVPGGHAQLSHAMTLCAPGAGMPADGSGAPSWAMWATHLAATVLTAWLLARGEAWLWRVADRIIAAAASPGPLRADRPAVVLPSAPTVIAGAPAHSAAAPRGPPAPFAAS
jgi:hypothetical protein